MTLPDERYRAINYARQFLQELCDPKKTPGVPSVIRSQAGAVLRHYPNQYELDQLAAAAPEVVAQRLDPVVEWIVSKERAAAGEEFAGYKDTVPDKVIGPKTLTLPKKPV